MGLRRQLYSTNVAALFGPLFLDGRADVSAAFSDRRLIATYAGPLGRLRRSSDNAELDFGTGLPAINWTDVIAWRDALGAATAFRVKRYDQSGNSGRDLAQSTAAAQPSVILAANGLIADLYNGVNQIMMTAAFTLGQPWSFNSVLRRVSTIQVNFENMIDGLAADSGTLFHNITGTGGPKDLAMFAGDFGPQSDNGVSMAVGVRGAVGGCFNAASSLLEVNATTLVSATGNPLGGTPGGLTVGCRADSNAGRFTNMEMQELIAFNTAHTSVQLKADNALMRTAWGF